MNVEESNLPFVPKPPQAKPIKCHLGARPPQRDVKNEDRPGYIYENTWKHDKVSDEMTVICAQLKGLAEISGF
jgi:hypothetical protein